MKIPIISWLHLFLISNVYGAFHPLLSPTDSDYVPSTNSNIETYDSSKEFRKFNHKGNFNYFIVNQKKLTFHGRKAKPDMAESQRNLLKALEIHDQLKIILNIFKSPKGKWEIKNLSIKLNRLRQDFEKLEDRFENETELEFDVIWEILGLIQNNQNIQDKSPSLKDECLCWLSSKCKDFGWTLVYKKPLAYAYSSSELLQHVFNTLEQIKSRKNKREKHKEL